MKLPISSLFGLAIVTVAALPAYVMATPTIGTAYYTDVTNSYVQDQTSQVMSQLNGILCYMGAMAPNLMVNSGDYIALIDQNVCESNKSGGQSGNTGPAYTATVVNSTRASNASSMQVKAWVEPQPGNTISVYATASQAPSAANATPYLPYGVFRMDYCGGGSPCTFDKGFINATSNGQLTFYSSGTQGSNSETTALLLNATSASSGSGAINQIHTWGGGGVSDFKFAYNGTHFVRNDQTGSGDQCFSRDATLAAESVWRYGLYDATTGARITRNSGFPIEYTNGGVTYNGYIGYYGLWMPVTVPQLATVTQIKYDANPPTKTNYTLLQTGGKLTKFTTANKTLAALNKVTFWYYAQNSSVTGMTMNKQYEIYWDNFNGLFVVTGMMDSSNNMLPVTTPFAVLNSEMVTANPWGIFGWSQMMGGQFGIKGTEFAKLLNIPSTMTGANINVVTQTQDIVYPSNFPTSLICINDCPTAALITTSNGGSGTAYDNQGWTPVGSGLFKTYTLDAASGNMFDYASTPAAVVSTAITGTNANGVRSGRLISSTDATAMITAKNAANVCGGTCTTFNQGDVDFLPTGSSYYVWETGGNPWNQIAILMNGATPITFQAPLQVNFAVPNDPAKYGTKFGTYAGATIALQYGGFGDLWGIPNECVDLTTNSACTFPATQQQQQNYRWTSKFSIPFDLNDGLVTTGATTYFVKPLDKEVRLAKVTCPGGLTTAGVSNTGLPTSADFADPTSLVGAKPTVTAAPQVIHGVKQY